MQNKLPKYRSKSSLLHQSILLALEDDTIDPQKLFYCLFDEICSMYELVDCKIEKDLFETIIEKYSGNVYFKRISFARNFLNRKINLHVNHFIVLKKNLLLTKINNTISIYYVKDKNNDDFNELTDTIMQHVTIKTSNADQLFLIVYENSFDLRKIETKKLDIDITLHYNDDFTPIHETVNDFLQKEQGGLVILHGIQGSGKSTYIKHLIKTVEKRFIYIPSQLAEMLMQPSFIPFLSHYPDSILILEDCEELLMQRQLGGRFNSALTTILNMTDGLLGDGLKLKFICTFNASLKEIDKALLRKGRLIAKYNFGKLETDKVNRLIESKKLPIPKVTESMSLADIFNYEGQSFETSNNKIGFN